MCSSAAAGAAQREQQADTADQQEEEAVESEAELDPEEEAKQRLAQWVHDPAADPVQA